MARKQADFKDNSMASIMNSGDSNDLNCIRIDPRTGEKFSFNVNIAAATAWQHPQQCTFIHACRYLNYIQKRKTAARCPIAWPHRVGPRRLSGSLYWYIGDVIHSHSIAWLRGFAKGLSPFLASKIWYLHQLIRRLLVHSCTNTLDHRSQK